MADRGDRERRVVCADAAGVVAEAHIQCIVQGVFDRPVTAGVGKNTDRGRSCQ